LAAQFHFSSPTFSMKKTLLSLLAAAALAPACAQIGVPNSFLLYGGAQFTADRGSTTSGNLTVDEPYNRSLTLTPGIGYQFNENWAAGVFLDFNTTWTDYRTNVVGQSSEDRLRLLNVGPFVRYTQPLGANFFAFTQLQFGYSSGKLEETVNGNPDVTTETDFNGVTGGFFPAVGARLSRCANLAFSVGGINYQYLSADLGPNTESKNSAIDVNFGQALNLTLQWYFGGSRGMTRMPMDETRRMDTSDDEDEMPRRRRRSGDDE